MTQEEIQIIRGELAARSSQLTRELFEIEAVIKGNAGQSPSLIRLQTNIINRSAVIEAHRKSL